MRDKKTGCMCMECEYLEVVIDNYNQTHSICVCRESDNFLKTVDLAWENCDFGEVETADDEEG